MSVISRQRQAARERALGISKPRTRNSRRKRADGFVVAPFNVTEFALQTEVERKKQGG